MSFGSLGALGTQFNRLGAASNRLAGFIPGATADLRFDADAYMVGGRRYATFGDVPGESSSGGVNGTVVRDGVIVRATEQNLLTYSEDFTNAAWSNTNISVSTDGTKVAGLLAQRLEVSATASTNLYQTVNGSGSSGGNAYSIYVAKGSGASDLSDFLLRNNTTATNLVFGSINYDTGEVNVVSGNINVEPVDGGWRVTLSSSVGISDGDTLRVYVGATGGTRDAGKYVYATGAQLREARYSDTYVPTTSAAITRAAPRIGDDGLLVEGAATNKCTAYAAPNDTTGLIKTGDAAATLTVVNDSVALAAAGLAEITGGKAYKLDNTAGSGSAFANVIGAVGNLNTHTASAYIRASDSSGRIGVGGSTSGATTSYTRLTHTQTPSSILNTCYIAVNAGAVVYFVLPQLEEGSTATSYIPTSGSSVTRTADSVTLTDLDALGLTSAVLGELDTPLDDDFTGYADQAAAVAAGYTFGTNASLDAVNDQIDYSSAADATNVRKVLSVTSGDTYVVEVVISNYSAGGLRVFVGSTEVITNQAANGTYTGTVTVSSATPNLDLRANGTTTLSVDSITIRRAEPLGGYTVVVEADYLGGSNAFPWLFAVNDGTGDNEAGAYQNGGNIRPKVQAGNASQADFVAGVDPGGVFKTAISFEANNISASIGGAAAVKDTSASLPSGLTQLVLANSANNQRNNWSISRLTIIPRAVSDAQLQALTS